MSAATTDQPTPTGDGPEVWPPLIDSLQEQIPRLSPTDARIAMAIVADCRARDRLGRERYGTPLRAHNGRDALVDAYQEALDLLAYLGQLAIERRHPERITGLLNDATGMVTELRELLSEREVPYDP